MERVRFDGKVAVVTGGSGGIGLAVCEELALRGARVLLVYSRKDASGIMKKFEDRNLPMEYLRMNVADPDNVRAGAAEVERKFGGADLLVTCAGVAISHPSLEYPDEDWRKTLAINLDGTFYCAREFGKQMLKKGGGSMVFIGSIAGVKAVQPETHASYGASKAAVIHLAKLLGSEWAKYNIRVNTLSPGYTNTEILKGIGAQSPETMETWLRMTPSHRLMEAGEIARVAAFLCSGLAAGVTGSNLMVDGGYSAW